MNNRKRNYILKIDIPEQDLDESKNPPICDGACNQQFTEENKLFKVNALILDNSFWGLLCNNEIKNYPKLPILVEKDSPLTSRVVRDSLGRAMVISGF